MDGSNLYDCRKGTPDQAPARLFSYQHRNEFNQLIQILADISADYLITQLKSGADAVQIFDSWSGVLSRDDFDQYCTKPVAYMVKKIRAEIKDAKIIGFPKGAGFNYLNYQKSTGVDCVGLDWTIPDEIGKKIQHQSAIQGNLDPLKLIAGGEILDQGVDEILKAYGNGPLIFNLGHGITPQTPIAHVEQLIKRVRG